jgi:peroxiredoxin
VIQPNPPSAAKGRICLTALTILLSSTMLFACGGAQNGATTPATASSPSDSDGEEAPDFTLPTLDGDSVTLSELRGKKVVLIDFWSTTCDPCLREMPELVKIYKERKDKGFEVLAITIDGPDTMAQVSSVVKSKNMIFPILLDEETEVMDRYNPKGELPFTAVINREGRIVLKRAGYQPGDVESMHSLIAAIDNAMAGK